MTRERGFASFGLKIIGKVVFKFGPQNSGEDDLRATHGVIGDLASRQSISDMDPGYLTALI
jgi:hypothetical protein